MSFDPGFNGVVGALPLNPPSDLSAKHKLKLSQLKLTQTELMGNDVDLTNFYAAFNGGGVQLIGAMTDAVVERTVQGADTLTCTITDERKVLLNSGLLSDQLTVEIDGLYWMLVTVALNGPTLTLTFNEREVVIARRHDKPIKQSSSTARAKVTRAEFALRMLREMTELPPIPYVIPALKIVQPVGTNAAMLASNLQKTHDKTLGIPKKNNLTVKRVAMTPEQRRNADTILVAGGMIPRDNLVMAMMTAIQEDSLINGRQPQPGDYNYRGADPAMNPVGCFQQIAAYGWPASRDVATDAQAFFRSLAVAIQELPSSATFGQLIWKAQNPNATYHTITTDSQTKSYIAMYQSHRTEAERIVDEYGVVPGGSAAEANNTYNVGQGDVIYEFYRGRPPTSAYQRKHGDPKWGKENNWDCWQRLASEVQWRCFFVSGTFYFISEDDLFKQRPIATIDQSEDGLEEFDGTYDSQGHASDITITCRMGRWAAPPGSVVKVVDHGPWDGRWLVNDVSRSVFNDKGTVVLKKPLPALPEPDSTNVSTANQTPVGKWAIGGGGGGQSITSPFPGGWIPNRLDMGWDGTFKGKLVAPFDGEITYSGYIGGSHPWGGYIVIKAYEDIGLPTRSLYFAEGVAGTHKAGDKVRAGDVIGDPAPSPYGNPYGTNSEGQIEWGVAEDENVGNYSAPHAQTLGLGSDAAAHMVLSFLNWANKNGVHGSPTSIFSAGNT